MKVVGIIASAHSQGHGATLVREALAAAAAAGAATEEIFLPNHRIEFCQGCLACLAEGRCRLADDFASLREILAGADGIVLGAPVFGAAMNARMKNFLDRLGMLEYITAATAGGKHLAAIATASNPGTAAKVARDLAGILAGGVFGRAIVSGAMGAKARGAGNQPDASSLARARSLGARLADDIRRGRKHALRSLPKTMLSRFLLRPMFSKAIVQHREGMMHGVYEELKGRGLLKEA